MFNQIALLALFHLNAVQAKPAHDANCKAVQTIEFRNSYLAAVYACPRALSVRDFNEFVTQHFSEISAANRQSLIFFRHRDGGRFKFDHLDTVVMNHVALQAVSDSAFCDKINTFKSSVMSQTVAEAMNRPAPFPLIRCESF